MLGKDSIYSEPVRLSLYSMEEGLHRVMQTGERYIRSVSEHLLKQQGKRICPALFYLFAKAFSLLAEYGNVKIIRKMAELMAEMSEAEIRQQAERFALDADRETYLQRIGKKTARFFAVCTGSGGIV